MSVALTAGLLEDPGAAAGSGAQLKSISAAAHAAGVSLTIEASDPVAYVTTRPDPLTVLLDFRSVDAVGVANRVGQERTGPISRVVVEPRAGDVPVTRVRVALNEPVAHRVRSDRSRIIVDFDPATPLRSEAGAGAIGGSAPPPAGVARSSAPGPVHAFAQSQDPVPGAAPSRTYTGHPISLDFQSADLRAVLRTFAEISGLNIVIDPTVQGSVDVALREVPWDQALDQILRANKLGYTVDGTIVRIAPLTVLAEEEKQRSALAQAQADAGELTTVTLQLSYARGTDLVTLIRNAEVLSARGQVFTDARTNTLIITDLEERLPNVRRLIATLDRPEPQVEIEARIVQTTATHARALGVQWGFAGRVDPSLGNTTNLAFPNRGTLSGAVGGTDTAVNLGAAGASSAVGLALGSVNGAFNLDVALSALERTGNARILSTPRVSTQNNVEAEIAQGIQVGYQTVANNTVTVSFRDAALVLRVRPQITAVGTVIMNISVDNGSLAEYVGGIPVINTQRANTTVLVSDGETTVIGGIYSSRETEDVDQTPGLGRIPLLRWLFKRDASTEENRELLIFITPRIVNGGTQ